MSNTTARGSEMSHVDRPMLIGTLFATGLVMIVLADVH